MTVTCKRCGENTQDYGMGRKEIDEYYCYPCCAEIGREFMEQNDKIDLYYDSLKETISNWPGSLVFHETYHDTGSHNIASEQTTVYFKDHIHRRWIGHIYGRDSQIIHCRLLKQNDLQKKISDLSIKIRHASSPEEKRSLQLQLADLGIHMDADGVLI